MASDKTAALVHFFTVMSNHLHIYLTDPQARVPQFTQEFHRLTAECIKAREATTWAREATSLSYRRSGLSTTRGASSSDLTHEGGPGGQGTGADADIAAGCQRDAHQRVCITPARERGQVVFTGRAPLPRWDSCCRLWLAPPLPEKRP